MSLAVHGRTKPISGIVIRLADLGISFALLIFASLPMVIIAVLIILEDRGPILFRQKRVGRALETFPILKFRTMTVDPQRADGRITTAATAVEREQFQTTVPGDTRITRFGRVLRPLHLDELPQLLNVFAGHMSVVGVRPDVPVQEADYEPWQWTQRHAHRPGITGLAQVSPSVDSMAARTALDLQWVRERSFGLYVAILVKTFGKVLKRNSL